MKKYENFDNIQKSDIQKFSGLESETLIHFINCIEKSYPLKSSCCGITNPCPNYYIKRHPALVFVLEHVISGKGYVVVNGKKYTVTAGDTYLIKPMDNCEYYADKLDPYKKIWVNFNGPVAQEIISQYQLKETIYKNVDLRPNFEKLFKLEEISIDLDIIHFDVATIITEMLILLAKVKSSVKQVPQIASIVKRALDMSVHKAFSLNNLVNDLFISKTEMIRQFKKAYDKTPYQYLLEIKVNYAKIMLLNSNQSIAEIASLLAFSSPYHFSVIFKRKTGLSPFEFRKNNNLN